MTVLVVGATGATGRLLVEQLLNRGLQVRAVVRSLRQSPLVSHGHLEQVEASLPDLDDAALQELVSGCDAIASCLGHNMTWRGIFGPPRRLVTDAVRRMCEAVKANHSSQAVRLVLMNTAANRNPDCDKPVSPAQRAVLSILRLLVPPHADNEQAADYLRTVIEQSDPDVEWVAVRPDSLCDAREISAYETHLSPTRSAIFNAGSTSRINVAGFMAELITNDEIWDRWKGLMPVVYNKDE
jgi:nucleoside-diphosphate-sugar epimerase